MRSLAVALAAVGLMAASTFGVVNVYLGTTAYTANTATMNVGDTLTVKVWNQAPTSGVMGLAGSITATPSGKLQALGQFAWTTQPTYPGTYGETLFVLSNFGFAGSAPYPNYTYSDPLDPTSITGWLGNYLYSVVKPLGQPAQTSPGALTTTWNLGGTPGSTDGSMANIGSGQCSMDFIGGNNPAVVTGKTSPVLVGSYQVKATAAGTVTLHFADSGGVANAGSYGGWYTAGRDVGDDGIGTATDLVITISGNVANLTDQSVAVSKTGQKTLGRSAKNVLRLTFSAPITLPTAGQLTIKPWSGGSFGADVSSNFTFTLESGNTVLKIKDNGSNLTSGTWYAFASTGWTGVNAFTAKVPVLCGDVTGDGTVNSSGDVVTLAGALGTSAASDADRNDVNGDGTINSSGDIVSLAAYLGTSVTLTAPF